MTKKTIICITGPTATGKSVLSFELAKKLNTCIISADSRTIYKEMTIGTAKPTPQMLSEVKHYFIDIVSIHDYYNAGKFGEEARSVIQETLKNLDLVIVTGGSTLYIHSLFFGLDKIPSCSPEVRNMVNNLYEKYGIDYLRMLLKEKDTMYYSKVDLNNPRRIMRALEVIIQTGKPFSYFLSANFWDRNLAIDNVSVIMLSLYCDKHTLRSRIINRLHHMIKNGLIDEVKSLIEYRHLYPLKTFVYEEFFAYLDGKFSFDEAFEKAVISTYRYAKRQLTWLKKYKRITWIDIQQIRNASDLLRHINL